MRRLGRYCATGLLVVMPAVATFALLFWAFTTLNDLIFQRMGLLVSDEGPAWWSALVGVVVTLGVLIAVGFLASNWLGQRVVGWFDSLLQKMPLVKLLYGSIKDLLNAFVGDKKSFDKPVVVSMNEAGAKIVGFVTRDSLDFLGIPGHVAIYFPQSYNFAGNVVVMPADKVSPLTADSSDVMAFLVSGGVSGSKSS